MGYIDNTPYVSGSRTSAAAAASMTTHVGPLEAKVLRLIKKNGKHGATDSEVETTLGLRHQTASARRRTLVLKGLVKDSGLTRKTQSGRQAVVWILGVDDVEEGVSSGRPPRPTDEEILAAVKAIKPAGHERVVAWLTYMTAQERSGR